MSLIGHLTELRARLIFCILAVFAFLIIGLFVSKPALMLLISPAQSITLEPEKTEMLTFIVGENGEVHLENGQSPPELKTIYARATKYVWPGDPANGVEPVELVVGEPMSQRFYYMSPIDPFMMRIKVSFLLAIFLSMPVILYQLWGFVRPGLREHEGYVVRWLMGGSVILFPIGAGFAFVIINMLLRMMHIYKVEGIEPRLDIYVYQSILVTFMIVFGLVFMMPMILALAARVGLVTRHSLQKYRRHAIVVLSVISMLITPADPFSMFLTLIPLIILYELSIILIRIIGERGGKAGLVEAIEAEEEKDAED